MAYRYPPQPPPHNRQHLGRYVRLWFLLGAGLLAASTLRAQIIDTAEDPNVTQNDSINRRLSVLTGFNVEILEPELISNNGFRVQNGFAEYYVHVVSAKVILAEGVMVMNRGERTYVAICTQQSNLKLDSNIRSRALFIKALVLGDSPEQKQSDYAKRAKKSRALADSMQRVVDSTFMAEPDLLLTAEGLRQRADRDSIASDAYKEFARTGFRGDDVAQFFMSRYFSRSEDFNCWTHPHGLPEIAPPKEEEEEKVDKRGKSKKTKSKAKPRKQKGGKWYR